MNQIVRLLRATGRLSLLALIFVCAAADFQFTVGRRASLRQRTLWLSRWSRRALAALAVQVRVYGHPPSQGAVVSNHLSYLDILVFSTANRQVFLAKSEIRDWPVIGQFTEWSGAPFIDRRRRSDLPRQNRMLQDLVSGGTVPTLFLEGTTTDGAGVLEFHSALLEPAVQGGWPITPAAIQFSADGGETATEVCWWGDMTFVGHLVRLAQLKSVTARVSFGAPLAAGTDRKTLATLLHHRVIDLKAELEVSRCSDRTLSHATIVPPRSLRPPGSPEPTPSPRMV